MVNLLAGVWIVPLLLAGGIRADLYGSAQFASGVSLVEVYATVTDSKGLPVTGLGAADFRITEDGVQQSISVFTAGEFPLAVAIGLDRSFSMSRDSLAGAVSAAGRFVRSLRGGDQVLLLAIGSQTDVVAPLSADRRAVLAALDRIDRWGTTPLYDAVVSAVDAIQPATGRRALVLISDGTDRYSQTTAGETIRTVRQKDVLVYPIALGRKRPEIFAELATVTGGRSFVAADAGQLDKALVAIGDELRFQYLLGYAPAKAASERPGWRGIDVSVARPGVTVRAREGYVAR